jgi:choline dehydrogenase-like flavoprotein
MKQHAVPWWLTTEDLPDPANRVTLENATPSAVADSVVAHTPSPFGAHSADDTDPTHADNQTGVTKIAPPGRIKLSYTPNNVESFERLKDRWIDVLKKAGHAETSIPFHAYFKKRIPLEGVGHQNGTCRMGADAATSVLDPHCKAHELDNLYVVDASCFVSASAVNPSLTIIANSIRVADHVLAERF